MKSILKSIALKFFKRKYNGKTIDEWCYHLGSSRTENYHDLIPAIRDAGNIQREIGLDDIAQLHLFSSDYPLLTLSIFGTLLLDKIPRENINKLITDLSHTDETIRRSSAIVLERIGTVETLSAVVQGKYHGSGIRTIAALHLKKYGEKAQPAIPALLLLLKDRDINWRSHFAAADALASIGNPAKDTLIKNLNSEDYNIQYYSAYALSILKPTPFVNSKIKNILSEKQYPTRIE